MTGLRQALEAAGAPQEAHWVAAGDYHFESGVAATRHLLEVAPECTAFFAANDLMAVGALSELTRTGRRVPEEISVVGYDDALPSLIVTPRLTTVRQPVDDMVAFTIDRLLRRIRSDGAVPAERHVLPVELVVRESTGGLVSVPST